MLSRPDHDLATGGYGRAYPPASAHTAPATAAMGCARLPLQDMEIRPVPIRRIYGSGADHRRRAAKVAISSIPRASASWSATRRQPRLARATSFAAMTIEIREGARRQEEGSYLLTRITSIRRCCTNGLPGISESAKIFAMSTSPASRSRSMPTVHYNMGGIATNTRRGADKRNGDDNSVVRA